MLQGTARGDPMEFEVSAQARDKALNRRVAMTVVIFSVAMGLCNIKDANIVQAMQQAKSDSVDRWAEYQATKTKWHIAETALSEIRVVAGQRPAPEAIRALAALKREMDKYRTSAPLLAKQARGFAERYDQLNVHDDQFDASEALLSTAVSVAAVAALTENFAALLGSWTFGLMGLFMGACGFAALAFHPQALSSLLG
jgi:hypothetical protein